MATKYFNSPMQIKAVGKKTFIEGWANKAKVDSCGDFMVPSGANMERFKLNPILLFNHNRDYPIGKVVEWELDDEKGVWIKAEVSSSDDPKSTFVRNLIEQGILQTFSIGYNENNAIKQSDGSRRITDWELHEVSAVTIPMNDASTFSLSKSLNEKDYTTAMEIITKALTEPVEETAPVVEPEVPQEQAPEEAKAIPETPADTPAEEPAPATPSEEENKPSDEELKAEAFQECVSKKIPKLIEEGKPQEQAVAMAISMCRDEGKCSIEPSEKQWADFADLAAKQASMIPGETTAIQNETPQVENDLMTKLQKLIEVNTNMLLKLDIIISLMKADDAEEAPASEPAAPIAPVEPSDASANEQAAKAARVAKIKQMFDNMDSTLKTLGV
jgi:HK97 family phage prohead protease